MWGRLGGILVRASALHWGGRQFEHDPGELYELLLKWHVLLPCLMLRVFILKNDST